MAATPKKKVFKFPKSMGACADLLSVIKEKRLAQSKIVDQMEAEEKALKEHIIQNLPKTDTGASGKLYRVSIVKAVVPQVKDWDKFYAYVAKNKRFDLLQKRVSETAVNDIWDNKKVVPGVEPFTVVKVSLNKI